MNTNQFAATDVEAWATFAEIQYRDAASELNNIEEYRVWVARTLAGNSTRSNVPQWTEDDCAMLWLRTNSPAFGEPPVERPAWATSRTVKAEPDPNGGMEWEIDDLATVGDAEICRSVMINSDHTVSDFGVTISIEGDSCTSEERVYIDSTQLEKVLATLTAVRDALNS